MFKFCRSVECSKDELLDNIQPCQFHKQPVTFICLQYDEKCAEHRLLCLQCLQNHKQHNWEPLDKYFDEKFRNSIRTGTSSLAKQVDQFYDTTMSEISKLKAKLNRKLDEIGADMKFQMNDLKQKYPLKSKFEISGKDLTNKTAQDFIEVRERQRHYQWTTHATNFIVRMFRETTLMLSTILDDFHMTSTSQEWEEITKESGQKKVEEYLKKYEGKYLDDPNYFKFSQEEHPPGIRVNQTQRQIKFVKASPSKPTAIVENVMNRWHSAIYFQVMKLDKTIVVFDKQLIAFGVCLPKVAKTYGYRGVIQPSHGGFLIGSNGRCYHTKLYKYEKSDSGFTYGQEDIIKVEIDYQSKMIKFEKITGFFKKRFEMQLGIEDEQIALLKPCVMFHGQQGAQVTILEEFQTTKKYQKNKKKQRKMNKDSDK